MPTDIRQRLIAAGIAAALPLIVFFEGSRQTAYPDPVGIPTICSGHTGGIRPGQTATAQQCDDYTLQDLLKARATMESCAQVPLNDNQRAAFTSFVYNVGGGKAGVKDGFCLLKSGKPSGIVTRLNAGDYAGACRQMLLWNRAGGQVLPGLTRRRQAETELCLKAPA